MKQITLKITVSTNILNQEYDYCFGKLKNEKVTFCYTNIKTGKETERSFTYQTALKLAIERSKDGRYKNFEYAIY